MTRYVCLDCQSDWESEEKEEKPAACPKCGSESIVGLDSTLEE